MVIVSPGWTTSVSALVAESEVESFTSTVKLEVPAVVGVPLRTPVELSDSPAGSVPAETLQVVEPSASA